MFPLAVRRAPWVRWAWLPLLVVMLFTGCQPRPQAASAVKVIVGTDGLYSISAEALRAAGFDLAAADNLTLRVAGRPVPWERVGLGKQAILRFYGRTNRQPGQTYRNVYWLEAGQGSAAPRPAPPATPDLADSGWTTVRVEEQKRYFANAEPGGDRWFWTSIFAPTRFSLSIELADPLPSAADLTLRFWGESSAPVNPDHRIMVTANGTRLGGASWDGQGPHTVTLAIPAGILTAGENHIEIAAPGDTGAPADAVLLDWAEVTYLRRLVVGDLPLEFAGEAPGYRVQLPAGRSRPSDVAVWEITDPEAPVPLADFVMSDGEVRFGSEGGRRRYAVGIADSLLRPEEILPVSPSTLPDWAGGADMVVVTVPRFRESLTPLVEARRQQGLRVAVLDAMSVYDAFSDGRPDPAAIKALVQHAQTAWDAPAPRYLLLAGDASYDPSGFLEDATEADIIPTQFISTTYTGWTASDVWFALPDALFADDGITLIEGETTAPVAPMLAVGRLPAQTPEQMQTMVGKILAYESGDPDAAWSLKALLPADNDDPEFQREAEAFAERLTGYDATVTPVEGDGSATRRALLNAFDSGVGVLGYTGHGSVTLWAQEAILSTEDVPGLDNADRLPIVFTVTCLSGFFVHPSTVSLGEALVRHADGGAAAALVPSGAALLQDQRPLSRALADALALPATGRATTGDRLGDAIVQAQHSITDQPYGVREVLMTFNLLGDPALLLRR